MKVSRCCVEMPPPSFTAIQEELSMLANRLLTTAVNVTKPSTRALAWPGTLIVRVCAERTNACATVSTKNRTRNYPPSFQHHPLLISHRETLNIGIQGYNEVQCECDHLNFSFFAYIIISNNCPCTRAVVLNVDRNF